MKFDFFARALELDAVTPLGETRPLDRRVVGKAATDQPAVWGRSGTPLAQGLPGTR